MSREGLAELWRERLDDYAESGGTVDEWCRFNRVSEHQYYYWIATRSRMIDCHASGSDDVTRCPITGTLRATAARQQAVGSALTTYPTR